MNDFWEQLINLLGDAIHVADECPLPVNSPQERSVHRRHRLLSLAVLLLIATGPVAVMAWYFR